MRDFGNFSLCLTFFLSLIATISAVWAGIKQDDTIRALARFASILTGFTGVITLFALTSLFLIDDFRVQYVWQYSSLLLPFYYKIAAVWGGMDGSMLFWAVLLGLGGIVLAARPNKYPLRTVPWILAVYNSGTLFFLVVTVFLTNPFAYLQSEIIPPDGNGLNPLLQNVFMAIHPPTIYLGFTLFAVPFAFCIGFLVEGQDPEAWWRHSRRWTLLAWVFLTCGIVLGAFWAYLELGWGGFWAWDPVENASFHPWLTATALLHTAMIQKRRKILRIWNVWLTVLTYGLTVFGTFITRSGLVHSVHAFVSTDIGWIFLVYLAIVFGFTLVLIFVRRKNLESATADWNILSRETLLFAGNLVLLSVCFCIIWGVMFPLISETLSGEKRAVSVGFFNSVTVPQFLLLLALMGIGPLTAWSKFDRKLFGRRVILPSFAAVILAVALYRSGIQTFYPLVTYGIGLFILVAIICELPDSFMSRRRAGANFAHLGVVLAAVAIASSVSFKKELDFGLREGNSSSIAGIVFTLNNIKGRLFSRYESLTAEVELKREGSRDSMKLFPELRYYPAGAQSTAEVGLGMGITEDIYLILAGVDEDGSIAKIKAFINPLQSWLWIGALVMVLGGLVAAWTPAEASSG